MALTSGFSTGYTPTFAIIGFNNKVYFDSTQIIPETVGDLVVRLATALNLAIDEFYRPLYVENPISDKCFTTNFNENIDLNSVFIEAEGNSMDFTITGNSNPEFVFAEINGSVLTIQGSAGDMAESVITVQAVYGENSATDEFKVAAYDPTSFIYLEDGFEGDFPPPFWEVKYNTSTDGGLNGANLIDPPTNKEWELIDVDSPEYGPEFIHTGNNSVGISWEAPDFNWFISPQMQLDYNDYLLKFWIWYESSSYETKFNVLVNNGSKGWVSILNWDASDPDNKYESQVILSLADYVGETIQIAFVLEYTDGWYLALDDIVVSSVLSGIENNSVVPSNVTLFQNYPNPFNPNTNISFSIAERSEINLSIFNHKGEMVKNIFDGKLEKGIHSFDFKAETLSSGVYYYSLKAGDKSISKKMVLMK